ncbi:hypothetical protein ABZ023_10440 [Streptomyces sp. NPDC006367]|uniref:hypothetical protein n=1 Tax=unclassified Streptomyces TaxID=2593676 RepID=UPI0033AA4D07
MLLMGALLIAGTVTAAAGIFTVLVLLSHPPLSLSLSRIYAFVALVLVSSTVALYCYGWFSVSLGGPFPELCQDENGTGAELTAMVQQYWPLRSACLYSDGSSVEHVSMWANVFVCLSAGAALVSTGASVFLNRRAGVPSGATS